MSKDKSVQDKINALNEKMAWFQSDDFSLDKAAEHYAEVESLADEIEKTLTEMKNDIEVLKQKFN